MPTDLYRHFDAEGRLLYVGISYGAIARLQQHAEGRAGWVSKIVRVEVQKFRTREAAERAEALAIQREAPLHNKRRPKPPAPKRRSLRPAHDHPTVYEWVCAKVHAEFAALPKEAQEAAARGEWS